MLFVADTSSLCLYLKRSLSGHFNQIQCMLSVVHLVPRLCTWKVHSLHLEDRGLCPVSVRMMYSGQGRTQVFKKVSVVTFRQQDYPVHTLRVSLCVSLRESWEKKWNQ